MKEQELIELGFEKCNESDWYYYTYDFNAFMTSPGDRLNLPSVRTIGFSLITNASDELVDGKWFVEIFENESIRFTNITDVITLIDLIKRNTIKG